MAAHALLADSGQLVSQQQLKSQMLVRSHAQVPRSSKLRKVLVWVVVLTELYR